MNGPPDEKREGPHEPQSSGSPADSPAVGPSDDIELAGEADGSILGSGSSGVAVATMKRPRSVARSAGIVSLAVMASRVLGLVREMVFAYFFGASKSFAYDAFVIAFRIPNMLRDLFAEGALSSAFVTVFSDYLVTKGEKEAFRLSNLIATALLLILGVLVVLGIIFAPALVKLIAGGFESDPQKFALTVTLTRIMMPFILLVALAAQAMGVLNARDRFAIPALSAAFFNVGSIVGGILFTILLTDPTFSNPIAAVVENPTRGIIGMAYGVLIGGLMQFGVQWPSLRSLGFHYRPMLSFADEGVRRILALMGPAVIGGAAVQMNVFINSRFASNIPGDGPVSWLSYAFRLMQFPIGVFGVAIATATLPSISRDAALSETGKFRQTLARSIRLSMLLTVPSAVGLAVLGRPIIALIYERGPFTPFDTAHTANALAFYAIGLAGYSSIKIMAPAFYALGDAKTPMRISLGMVAVNFVMNWLLVGPLGERGLALSTSAVALANFGLLYAIMRRRIGGIDDLRTGVTTAKILVASLFMAVACWGASAMLGSPSGRNVLSKTLVVGISVLTGGLVFYASAWFLRIDELKSATSTLTKAFKRFLPR